MSQAKIEVILFKERAGLSYANHALSPHTHGIVAALHGSFTGTRQRGPGPFYSCYFSYAIRVSPFSKGYF